MTRIELNIKPIKGPIILKPEVELLVNGEGVGTGSFGETISVDVEPGSYEIQALQHSLIKRKSKKLKVNAAVNSTVKIVGKYSRFWGNVRIFNEN
ncbi:hypothetical protein NJR55_08350 [Idiomarina sp. M1R2S28]|uniref:Uncharacterized protein n=1 Tax=Idiomarina rhizosphaerae TaxID=2961572 RepID=A0A9X2G1Q2_9GAMM|nr:hypothetical protein [Idiomarina rhizosphaerae]MCP1339606.1 hypothetical protein [Idiomarina rhizosphaerae]